MPYVPGRPPKMRAVARRQSPASSSTSASTCLRTKFCSTGSSSPATSVDRVVEQVDEVREGVAEEAADPHRHVDPRATQISSGIGV